MIRKLTGEIVFADQDEVVIDVNGVGYLIHVSSSTLAQLKLGLTLALWIHSYVKDGEVMLFGFITKEEMRCFEILIKVQGVGGKVALAILSSIKVEMLLNAILTQDIALFKTVSGIGPKLASRIVNELKDKKLMSSNIGKTCGVDFSKQDMATDAASALANLGFSQSDALSSARTALLSDPELDLEELIKKCLVNMS